MFQMKTARFPEVIKSRVNSLSHKKDTAKTKEYKNYGINDNNYC